MTPACPGTQERQGSRAGEGCPGGTGLTPMSDSRRKREGGMGEAAGGEKRPEMAAFRGALGSARWPGLSSDVHQAQGNH